MSEVDTKKDVAIDGLSELLARLRVRPATKRVVASLVTLPMDLIEIIAEYAAFILLMSWRRPGHCCVFDQHTGQWARSVCSVPSDTGTYDEIETFYASESSYLVSCELHGGYLRQWSLADTKWSSVMAKYNTRYFLLPPVVENTVESILCLTSGLRGDESWQYSASLIAVPAIRAALECPSKEPHRPSLRPVEAPPHCRGPEKPNELIHWSHCCVDPEASRILMLGRVCTLGPSWIYNGGVRRDGKKSTEVFLTIPKVYPMHNTVELRHWSLPKLLFKHKHKNTVIRWCGKIRRSIIIIVAVLQGNVRDSDSDSNSDSNSDSDEDDGADSTVPHLAMRYELDTDCLSTAVAKLPESHAFVAVRDAVVGLGGQHGAYIWTHAVSGWPDVFTTKKNLSRTFVPSLRPIPNVTQWCGELYPMQHTHDSAASFGSSVLI